MASDGGEAVLASDALAANTLTRVEVGGQPALVDADLAAVVPVATEA